MTMICPNRKGNMGPRVARAMKNTINRDHGCLLQKYEVVNDRK